LSNDLNSNSRSGYRTKRKKTNIVLNSLIIVVLLLIIFVAYNIFATGNDNASPKEESTKTEQKATENKETTDQKEAEEATATDDENLTESTAEEEELSEDATTPEDSSTTEDETTPEDADDSQAVVTEGDGNSNVIKSTENPAWQPAGTSQTGEHTAVYDQSSVDWQEMLNAISYATGLDKSNMTVYWLGRDKSTENGSFSTVASKDKQQKFNVYLQWVDGQGWKPTKVEELAEIN
jgi:cytoskeletal protein RodZ